MQVSILYIFFFVLPTFIFIFNLYIDYLDSRDKVLQLSNEINVLLEKQNILISEMRKIKEHVSLIENTSLKID